MPSYFGDEVVCLLGLFCSVFVVSDLRIFFTSSNSVHNVIAGHEGRLKSFLDVARDDMLFCCQFVGQSPPYILGSPLDSFFVDLLDDFLLDIFLWLYPDAFLKILELSAATFHISLHLTILLAGVLG